MPPYAVSSQNPTHYTRPIDTNETFIKIIGDSTHALNRTNWSIHSFTTLEPLGALANTLPIQLRKAWAHLRFQQPSIAVYVTEDDQNFAYDVPDAEELEKWIDESFSINEDAENAAEIVRGERMPRYWTLTYVQRSGEVLCHTAHWRSDGIGVMQLFDALLEIVANAELSDPVRLSWGEEISRLAPSVEDVMEMPRNPRKEQQELGRKYFETFGLVSGAVGIQCLGDDNTVPGGTLFAKRVLDKESTRKIVEACKENGISITSAVHASIAMTNWKLANEETKGHHYTSTMRFCFKPYLPRPYGGPASAAGLYTTGWMERVEPNQTWLSYAQHFNSIYRQGLSREFINSHGAYANNIVNFLRNSGPVSETVPPASHFDISSVGIVERHLRRRYGDSGFGVEVLDFGEGVETLGRPGGVFVWTFWEKLNLSVVFNERFHTLEQMKEFVNEVQRSLMRELGVVA